ncbi:MAG: hypothetical protein ABIE42_10285 [Candidatus Eisenbacteria bacterium]
MKRKRPARQSRSQKKRAPEPSPYSSWIVGACCSLLLLYLLLHADAIGLIVRWARSE